MNTTDRIVGLAAGVFLLLGLAGIGARTEPASLGIALSALATSGLFALLAVGLAGLRPGPRGAVVERLGLGPGTLPVGTVVLLCIGTLALSNVLETMIALLQMDQMGTLAEIDEAIEGTRGPELLAVWTALSLGAGLAEELFFRGLVQRGLARQLAGRPGAAALSIGCASLAFGLAHWDLVHSSAALLLGAYLGVVAHLAGSIRPAIACHIFNNALAVFGSAFAFELPIPGVVFAPAELALVGAVLALAARKRQPDAPAVDLAEAT